MFQREWLVGATAVVLAGLATHGSAADGKRLSREEPASLEQARKDFREEGPLSRLRFENDFVEDSKILAEHPTTDEMADRQRIRRETELAFIGYKPTPGKPPQPDMDALDELISRYRDTKERTGSGVWKLTVAYRSWESVIGWTDANGQLFETHKKSLQRLLDGHPQSPTPYLYVAGLNTWHAVRVLHDRMLLANYLGGVAALKDKLAEQKRYLEEHKDIASKDPHWYALMMVIMSNLGSPLDDILQVELEGAERYPDYYDIYFEAARAIGRRSSNPFKDWETLANTAVKTTNKAIGDELYARIYWVVLVEAVPTELMGKLQWDWSKMTSSMRTVLKTYPDQWNVQNFARFSCLALDHASLKEFMGRVEGPPQKHVWDQPEYFRACSDWAAADETPAGPDTRKVEFSKP